MIQLSTRNWKQPTNKWNQFSSVSQSYLTLCDPMNCSSPGLLIHHHPGNHSNLCPLSHSTISLSVVPLSSCPQSSLHQDLFKCVNFLHQVAKVLEFQLQHQSLQWTPRTHPLWDGLVGSSCSPRDSQESSKHHSSKTSILQHSAFFIVQLSHPYMTTGKTIALTRQAFVDKVMPLLFNMLSMLVITFIPRSKRLLISWLQSPFVVIWAPQNKVWYCFHCFPIYFPWSDGTGCHDLRFLNVELFTLLFHFHQEAF